MEVTFRTHLPGGPDFRDVSAVFTDAANDLGHDELLFSEGFTLQDSMSAFEIGEPRLDSGFDLDEDKKPPFDPLTPLLPEEICWILDRAFACEMEWHSGTTLSQTVFTFLFMYHLDDLDPDFVPEDYQASCKDPARPLELVTLVLRAAVFGLLKCCDLSWRELMRGGLHDGEDWQSEKCGVSLLEGQPVNVALDVLNNALNWLSNYAEIPDSAQAALIPRILLRKTLLELLDLRIHKHQDKFSALITVAREMLEAIRANPSPEPASDSPALLAFDSLVARRLNTFVPSRSMEPTVFFRTWDVVEALLDDWDELATLSATPSISTWVLAGNLRIWLPGPLQSPYARSSIQNAFFDNSNVLHVLPRTWIVDRFFIEMLGIPYETLAEVISDRWIGDYQPPFDDLQQDIIQLMTSHVRGLWSNPPRRRRHLVKSILNWHTLYDSLLKMTSNVDENVDPAVDNVLRRLPATALAWRSSTIRDVVLSGFQLELYSPEEKCFAYWYASRVIKAHIASINDLLTIVDANAEPHAELRFQHEFMSALRIMCTAMFSVTIHIPFRGRHSHSNFLRRYKWAFRPEYGDIQTLATLQPSWEQFLEARTERSNSESYSPSDSVRLAGDILVQLMESSFDWAGPWAGEVVQLLHMLADNCEVLARIIPSSMPDVSRFEVSRLKWDVEKSPWFPVGCDEA